MRDLQAIIGRVEIEPLRGEFTDAVMMRDYDGLASLFTPDGAVRIPHVNKDQLPLPLQEWPSMTTTTSLSQLTGDYILDTAHTRIGVVAWHTMATKVPGQFGEFEGSAHLDGDDPPKLSAQLTIHAKSIQTRNQQRDKALRSEYLDTGNHTAVTFTSTKVKQAGDTNFTVTGDLTIRGETKPVTVDFKLTGAKTDPWGNFRAGFEGSATINRKDWAVHWNAAPGVVSKKVTLEFHVAAIRQS